MDYICLEKWALQNLKKCHDIKYENEHFLDDVTKNSGDSFYAMKNRTLFERCEADAGFHYCEAILS